MTLIDDIDALEKKATAGPWYIDLTTTAVDFIGSKSGVKIYSQHYSGDSSHPDAQTLVALRNNWQAVSRALRAAEAFLDADHSHFHRQLQASIPGSWEKWMAAQGAFRQALAELEGK